MVVIALVVTAVSRFVPLSAIQFYLQGVACCVALLPLARSRWTHRATTTLGARPAMQAR
jgi:hypothetical protein